MTLAEPSRHLQAPLFDRSLAAAGDRIAVVTAHETVTYAELDRRVEAVATELGPHRRLVLLEAANALEPLVAYLGALRAGHPVLLAPGGNEAAVRQLATTYDPDVVMGTADGWAVRKRRYHSAHDLHPDLALLLATSGSTGSAKLVRLSRRNLQSNAESIAQYLGITEADRAVTTLPMQYCYGLSVINSHLLQGAGLVLTDLSVVDRCYWDLFRATDATSFAGVPHTFDLLDSAGFASMSLPSLRCVTQAGGRLQPDKVRRYAALADRGGWQFFVMYGQTEATARMAYLPPHRASSHPHAIGVPIPGGSFTIDTPGEDGVGELVYRGPNVMLGYAEHTADLALGATVDALHTGDLARVSADGLYEMVGRRSRFLKIYGLRIDLDQVERMLTEIGVTSTCTGDDDHLVVAVGAGVDTTRVARFVSHGLGVPLSRVCVVELAELPRLDNGKPDYATIRLWATAHPVTPVEEPLETDPSVHRSQIRAAFADVLGTEPSDQDTFVSLGGDSLSYVEVSTRLEQTLGTLPPDWHVTPIGQLSPSSGRRPSTARLDTSVAIRAVAILLVVGTHAKLWHLPGGAHALLAVAGFNFARFQLRATTAATLATVARIAVPSMCWIGAVAVTSERFSGPNALLLNGQFGVPDGPREYWFIQSIVQILAVLALLFAVRRVRRIEQRWPFAFAATVAVAALAFRFRLLDLEISPYRLSRPHEILWLFALGWAAARATTRARRVLVSLLAIAAIPGFFGNNGRDLVVLGALLLVTWARTVPMPRQVGRLVGVVAGASLFIYLTHWQVYPPLLRQGGPVVAVIGSVAFGVALWFAVRRLLTAAERSNARRTRRSRPAPEAAWDGSLAA